MAEPMRQAPPECWLGLGGFGVLRGLCRGLWRCRLWRQFGFLFRGELLLDFEADRVHVHLVRGGGIVEHLGGRLGSRDQTGHWVAGALRWQMGLITVAVALVYLLSSLGAAGSGTLPPVPWWALVVLALSHGAWLASVARRRPGSRLS